ncbi:MAG: HAMP domain-containing sensor histidine kinase [Microbacteriaceae bacterium]
MVERGDAAPNGTERMRAGRRFRSVRARATLGAVAVVLLALVGGSAIFAASLSASLEQAVARNGELRAEELGARVEAEGPGVLEQLDDDVAQLVDEESGAVLAATDDADGLAIRFGDDPIRLDLDREPVLVVAEDAGDDRLLLLALPVEDELDAVSTVVGMLAIAVPLLTAVVGATTWLLVGRALRPVDRIRSEVEAISGDRLDRRVPVPASGDEIAALATTMNSMLDRLDGAARAQRRFVSDASHELRSPLATIRQHAELAAAHPATTSTEELAQIVHEEGLRLQGLVDALLTLARLDEGAPLAAHPVDLDDLALTEASRLKGLGAQVDASGIGPARVSGDERMLGQALRNLAENARRHAAGRVALAVTETSGWATVTVEDDGAGVPEAERERVFERFVRLDEARAREAGGSGLGLAIVRGIVAAHGGAIAVDASRWGGARFTVRLPSGS